jgi:hypothetical protein
VSSFGWLLVFWGNSFEAFAYARFSMRTTNVLWGIGMVGFFVQGCGEERDFGNDRTNTTQNNETTEAETSESPGPTQAPENTTEEVLVSSSPSQVWPASTEALGEVTLPDPQTDDRAATSEPNSEPTSSAAADTSAPTIVAGPVQGRVIDFWGNPVPNLDINIEGKHATTDDAGAFELEVNGETYDVSFVVEIANPHTVYGWRFEHLSRRDPTLQVYTGLPVRETTLLTTFGNELSPNDLVGLGIGTENANASRVLSGPTYVTPDWRGPTQTLANLHAVWWSTEETSELPTAYVGYYETSIALTESEDSEVVLEFESARLDVDNVSGSVAYESAVARTNAVYVQFQDGASIQIVDDGNPTSPDEFLYLAPSLPNASLIVAVSEGEGWGASYAMSHKRGIAPGTLDVALDLPLPPKQSRPVVGDGSVTWDTEFGWTLQETNNKVVLIHVEDASYMQGLYIVTDRPTTHLPTFDSFELRKGGEHLWEVETHMDCASTDDCAGDQGFLDPLVNASTGIAKWARDGSYTVSGTRGFTVAN